VRNIKPGFKAGLKLGVLNAGIESMLGGKTPWTLRNHATFPLEKLAEYESPNRHWVNRDLPPRDRLSSVFFAVTAHDEVQPAHLKVRDKNICATTCATEYGNPCTRFCPAHVYEMVDDEAGGKRLQINAANCVHCKACDIKDPYQIIEWVTPEGGLRPQLPAAVTTHDDVLGALYAREIAKRGFAADTAQLVAVRQSRTTPRRAHRGRRSAARTPVAARAWSAHHRAQGRLSMGRRRARQDLVDGSFLRQPHAIHKRRTHFYRFMQDVHADLRRLKGMTSPLDGVADKIAKKAQGHLFRRAVVSDIADAMILAGLFGALIKRGVALVFTSNVKPKDLYKGGLQRDRFVPTIALLEKHCEVVPVDGGVDYRLRQLTAAPIYLCPWVA
jgi:ferredoxin-like protein FixX